MSTQETPVSKPDIRIPGGPVTVTQCAGHLFGLIQQQRRLFNRGGQLVEVIAKGGEFEFDPVTPAAAVSRFEDYARFVRLVRKEDGEFESAAVGMTERIAKLLLESRQRKTGLDTITGVLQFPVLVGRHGGLVTLQNGFDPVTGLFIASGVAVVEMSAAQGAAHLRDLLADYQFQSPGDLSRALASFLTPALKFGGFINGPIPIDVGEADDSQAGKSFRQTLVPALYNHAMSIVTVPNRGVGSLDESIAQALIRGKPFIQIDNLRGKLNSQMLESLVTANGEFNARAAFQPNSSVDGSRVMIFISSNGFEATADLANRSSLIRLRKRPGHIWRTFDGKNLRQHVQANVGLFQGAVMAVIREWHARGAKRTQVTEHAFQDWCQILDSIVQDVLKEAPLLEGYHQARNRVTNPHLSFLRLVILRLEAADRLGTPVTATNIVELCGQESIEIPGLRVHDNDDAGRKQVGRILGGLFKTLNELVVEDFRVVRAQSYGTTEAGNSVQQNSYQVTRLGAAEAAPDVIALPAPFPLAWAA